MRQKPGLISIGIALIMLIFSLIAATVISNISSNLFKNIINMDEGKDLQYKRIVVMSLKNAVDAINRDGITTPTDGISFTFSQSKDLVKNPKIETFPATVTTFPATATLAAKAVKTTNATLSFFELYTKHKDDDENYGIVVQYEENP